MTQSRGLPENTGAPFKVRASVSLPTNLHAELEQIARDKRVSLAWVIRDAAEQYVLQQQRSKSEPA